MEAEIARLNKQAGDVRVRVKGLGHKQAGDVRFGAEEGGVTAPAIEGP